jgi:DNA-binding FadR family transcriptional regulator
MSHQDLYRELSKKVGTEHSQIVPEIWKTVCTPEEATLLNVLPATIEELAQRFEKSREAITNMLQVLFHKGLVFKANREGKTVYRMPRHIIQFTGAD